MFLMDDTSEEFTDHVLFDPYELDAKHLESIRAIARVVMRENKCDYTKSIIIAYIKLIEMTAMKKTEH